MGVSTIWFMPVYPIGFDKRKGTLGSHYAIADYTKVNPELGTFEEFRDLVKDIRDMGMHVIMDWVANHTAWDHGWVSTQPEWYTHRNDTISHPYDLNDNPTDWYDVADLNYSNGPMRNTMIESMKFWLRATDIEGFRCDVAHYVPNDFWNDVRPGLESIKPVLMIAESEGVANHFETCFQANYGLKLYHLLNDVAKGDASAEEIRDYVLDDRSEYPAGYYHMNFTSNHDENSHQGSARERLGKAVEALAVLSFTMDGLPLIYGGQEAGLEHSLPAFEKASISWDSLPLADFYSRLMHLKRHNKALWNGKAGGTMEFISDATDVLAFEREMDGQRIVVVVNCSDAETNFTVTKPVFAMSDLFTGSDMTIRENEAIKLKPWQYYVLANPSVAFE
jgi:glycosidase